MSSMTDRLHVIEGMNISEFTSAQAKRHVSLSNAIAQLHVVRHALMRYPTGALDTMGGGPTKEFVSLPIGRRGEISVSPGFDPEADECSFTISSRRDFNGGHVLVAKDYAVWRMTSTFAGEDYEPFIATPADMLHRGFEEGFVNFSEKAYDFISRKVLPRVVALDAL
jgi:hypothetical protein